MTPSQKREDNIKITLAILLLPVALVCQCFVILADALIISMVILGRFIKRI